MSSGFVVRRKDDADKRTNVVGITDEVRQLAERVAQVRDGLVDALFRNLTEDEAETIVQLLRRAVTED